LLLDVRIGCENPTRGKGFRPCVFDPRGEALPVLAPGARVWLGAGATPDARLLVVGEDPKGGFRVLSRQARVGALRDRDDGRPADAMSIPLAKDREAPSTILVVAYRDPIPALEGLDEVDCVAPSAAWAVAACEELQRVRSLVPPRPRCCVRPDLGAVTAGHRILPAAKAAGKGEPIVAVEFQFRGK
jgi:hypothetical protein